MIRTRCAAFSVPFLVLLAANVLPAGQAPAPAKKLLAVDDLYRFDAPRDAVLSPDGKSLVYVRQWIDATTKAERYSLWIVDGDATKAKPMEKDEPDARAPVFSPDGKWIAFLSTRPRPKGWTYTPSAPLQSDAATDIWLIPAAGGEAIPLAGEKKPYARVFNDGFYGRLAFSPDSTKLAFVADGWMFLDLREILDGVKLVREDQGEGYTGWGTAQLWVAHLDPQPKQFAAKKIDRLTDDDVWYGDPNWSPDNRTLAVHANRTDDRESVRFSINKNFDIWAIDTETKKLTQLTTGPGPEVSPRFSPDGKRIACLSVPRKGTHRDECNLAIIDLGSEKPAFRVLFDHHDATKDGAGHPRAMFPLPVDCWDGQDFLVCNAEAGADNQLVRVSTASGRGEKFTPELPKEGAALKTVGNRISRRNQLTPPGNLFLKERHLGEQKIVTWKSDEFQIEGHLMLPPEGVAKPPYKLLVHPHGGPHGRHSAGFDFTVQVFAAKGYAVLQPNFRGSTGYGQKFIDADRGDFGGGDMRDIMLGIDKLIADGIADKDRLFVHGTSYGGYMTTWLVGQTDRFRAAAAVNAVTDLNMMWHLSDIPSWTEWEFGGKPWEVPEKMRKHSPLTYADKVKTPTLILHSRDDRRCPLPMGQAYHKALKARGVPTELVIYNDEGHGIRQPRHREDALNRVLDWFEKYDKK
ncbi:MAG: S9 family peptidase [Planctomycetes bacterium]|nr:S9 family peptidase [Planctomycetota bacterium]